MLVCSVMICGAGCSGCLHDLLLLFRKCLKVSLKVSIPSLWGISVYSDDTCLDTRMHTNMFDSMILRNEVESCMYNGNCLTYGCSQWSMNVDMFSVMRPHLEMMGLNSYGFSLRIILGRFCRNLVGSRS